MASLHWWHLGSYCDTGSTACCHGQGKNFSPCGEIRRLKPFLEEFVTYEPKAPISCQAMHTRLFKLCPE